MYAIRSYYELPDTLIHFYCNPDGPFRSISELPESDWPAVMNGMAKDNTWYDERFGPEVRADYMQIV